MWKLFKKMWVMSALLISNTEPPKVSEDYGALIPKVSSESDTDSLGSSSYVMLKLGFNPKSTVTYFTTSNDDQSNYALRTTYDWRPSDCPFNIVSSGSAITKIMDLDCGSSIYAGVNTITNITDPLRCIENEAKQFCERRNMVVALGITFSVVLLGIFRYCAYKRRTGTGDQRNDAIIEALSEPLLTPLCDLVCEYDHEENKNNREGADTPLLAGSRSPV